MVLDCVWVFRYPPPLFWWPRPGWVLPDWLGTAGLNRPWLDKEASAGMDD